MNTEDGADFSVRCIAWKRLYDERKIKELASSIAERKACFYGAFLLWMLDQIPIRQFHAMLTELNAVVYKLEMR